MANTIDSVINYKIHQNNLSLKLAFPAVVINTENLIDGLIDVQPLVRYMHPLTSETMDYPILRKIPIIFPSTKNSSFCFPVQQGDFVDLIVQSSDIQGFKLGNREVQNPTTLNFNNIANAVAFVGFSPYQDSCFNPNNYSKDFNNQDLNIVHNKNTDNESSISINTEGEITLRSSTKVIVESKDVQVVSDTINVNNATISTNGDVLIQGQSVNRFMKSHTHIDSQGSPTLPPTPLS